MSLVDKQLLLCVVPYAAGGYESFNYRAEFYRAKVFVGAKLEIFREANRFVTVTIVLHTNLSTCHLDW